MTAEAPLLDASSFSAGRVMDNRSVMDLPTFNNSPLMLIKLVPGIQASSNRRYNGVNALGGTAEAHNAGNVGGNDWSIDGVPNMGNGYSRRLPAVLHHDPGVQSGNAEFRRRRGPHQRRLHLRHDQVRNQRATTATLT